MDSIQKKLHNKLTKKRINFILGSMNKNLLDKTSVKKYLMKSLVRLYLKQYKLGYKAPLVKINNNTRDIIKTQLSYLVNFLDEDLTTNWKRIYNYIKVSDGFYELAKLDSVNDELIVWRTSGKSSCKECLELAHNSPYKKENLKKIPRINTQCMFGCNCTLEIT